MLVKAVLFDFDGPINDSFREGLRRIEVLCGINGLEFNREKRRNLLRYWGLPGVKLLQLGLGIPEDEAVRVYQQWEIYDLVYLVPLVPGSREMLIHNRLAGIVNTLITSRNRDNVLPILEKHGIRDYFSVIQTKQDWPIGKFDPTSGVPNPKVFDYALKVLQNLGIGKEECVFVGDTPSDVECGLAAGIEMVVVLTGPYWMEHFINYPRLKPQNILPSVDYFSEWLDKYAET